MSMSVCKAENLKMGFKRMPRSPIAKVKRSLFGPVDPQESRAFLQLHFAEEFNRGCTKWNFNFHEEKTHDPKGEYIWEPAGAVLINRKRKVEVVVENASCYFQPIEPAARSNENQPVKVPKQTHITDFMVQAKRPVVCTKESERPKKIPKLAEICSS